MTGRNFKVVLVACLMMACMNMTGQNHNDAASIVEYIKTKYVPDKRQGVYEVEVDEMPDGVTIIKGKISDKTVLEALESMLEEKGVKADMHIKLLPQDKWGQVKISVGCMRTRGSYSAELATQAIMGMPLRLLENENGWWRVQSPDGYIGWMWRGSIAEKTPEELSAWRKAARLVVTSHYQVQVYDNAKTSSAREVLTDLVPGSIVEGKMKPIKNGRVEVTLPDGRKGWVDAKSMTPIEKWAAQNFDADVILDQAYALEGAPYLWGGTSAKATDCSGLVKVSYLANGLMLRRDASQQALIGTHLEPEDWRDYQAGDLMFFGEKPGGRVTHVAIYDNDGMFIHCAGRVHRSSIDPESPEFVNRIFFGGSRIHGNEGTDGIIHVRDHPWYF